MTPFHSSVLSPFIHNYVYILFFCIHYQQFHSDEVIFIQIYYIFSLHPVLYVKFQTHIHLSFISFLSFHPLTQTLYQSYISSITLQFSICHCYLQMEIITFLLLSPDGPKLHCQPWFWSWSFHIVLFKETWKVCTGLTALVIPMPHSVSLLTVRRINCGTLWLLTATTKTQGFFHMHDASTFPLHIPTKHYYPKNIKYVCCPPNDCLPLSLALKCLTPL